jgi:hypothetical protein
MHKMVIYNRCQEYLVFLPATMNYQTDDRFFLTSAVFLVLQSKELDLRRLQVIPAGIARPLFQHHRTTTRLMSPTIFNRFIDNAKRNSNNRPELDGKGYNSGDNHQSTLL